MNRESRASAPAQPSLARTVLERRARKRSKEAARKVATQRAQEREEREAAARRKSAANQYALHIQGGIKSRKGRAGKLAPSKQGRSGGQKTGTGARAPQTRDGDSRSVKSARRLHGTDPPRIKVSTDIRKYIKPIPKGTGGKLAPNKHNKQGRPGRQESGTEARPPQTRNDDSRQTHQNQNNAEQESSARESSARARARIETVERKLQNIVVSLGRYRDTVRLAREKFVELSQDELAADYFAAIGSSRLGLLPPESEESLPSSPAQEVETDEEDVVTAFTAVTAAVWEALSFAIAWQREQQGGDLPTEPSADEGDDEGVERLSPFEGDGGAAEDEVGDLLRVERLSPFEGDGGAAEDEVGDLLNSTIGVPSSSLMTSSERVESRSPPEGDSSAAVGAVVEDSEVAVNAACAEKQNHLAQDPVSPLASSCHPPKLSPSDGLATTPVAPAPEVSSEHLSENEVRSGVRSAGGDKEPVDFCQEWPEYPWWHVLEDTIKVALNSMSLEELNDRMELHYEPPEPLVEELEGEDRMEFPPPPEAPEENDAVIPARVVDSLLDDPDEIAMAGVLEVEGFSKPGRDAVDATRWMAYDAANDFLARKRAARVPRRSSDRPPPNGKMLHRLEGFRCFSSMEQAVLEVTEAVLGQDGACQAGRRAVDFAETSLESRQEEWVRYEEDEYFLKCQLAENILDEMIADTLLECKRIYAFGRSS